LFFYIQGEPFRLIFLNIKSPILWNHDSHLSAT
jgi:hypothetical protein